MCPPRQALPFQGKDNCARPNTSARLYFRSLACAIPTTYLGWMYMCYIAISLRCPHRYARIEMIDAFRCSRFLHFRSLLFMIYSVVLLLGDVKSLVFVPRDFISPAPAERLRGSPQNNVLVASPAF
jgi:hypothetical protein